MVRYTMKDGFVVENDWYGGYCPTCDAPWVIDHVCTRADLLRRISDLRDLLDRTPE